MAELRKLRRELECRFSVEITDDAIRGAMRVMNRERKLRRGLASLMTSIPPHLTGRTFDVDVTQRGPPCDECVDPPAPDC